MMKKAISRSNRSKAMTKQIKEMYRKAIVIDCLSGPQFEKEEPTKIELKAVVSSGITAVNMTIFQSTFDLTVRDIANVQNLVYRYASHFELVREHADILHAKRGGKLGLILGFQGVDMIGINLSLLDVFQKLGVRIIQLTYNTRNLLGDGCMESANAGLSNFGRAVVEHLNELKIAIDLSHASFQTTAEAITASKNPIIISHTGCRAIYNHPRNQDDQELRAVAEKGGVVGIYWMPYLGSGPGEIKKEELLHHIEHALNVCGIDHVGIGSDQSVVPSNINADFWQRLKEDIERRKSLGIGASEETVAKRRHSTRVIERVLGGNFSRVFKEIWSN
jgi:membrane dipeptidase